MELLKITLVSIVILMLTSCSTTTLNRLGYWENSYTKSASFWQCVEIFSPHSNKDC